MFSTQNKLLETSKNGKYFLERFNTLNFTEIIQDYSSKSFVISEQIQFAIDTISLFMENDKSEMPYFFIIGEQGIGKTALLVHLINQHKHPVIYFVNKNKITTHTINFVKCIYHQMCDLYRLKKEECIEKDMIYHINLLKNILKTVEDKYLYRGNPQKIFIDNLDDSLLQKDAEGYTILDVLEYLNLSTNFKIIATTSRTLPSLTAFREAYNSYRSFSYSRNSSYKEYGQYLKTISYFLERLGVRSSANYKIRSKNILILSASKYLSKSEYRILINKYLNTHLLNDEDCHNIFSKASKNPSKLLKLVGIIKSKNNLQEILNSDRTLFVSYYNEFVNIINTIDNSILRKHVWQVIRLIIITDKPLEPELILKILDIDLTQLENIFVNLEPYFDQGLYFSNESKCSFNDVRIKDFLESSIYFSLDERKLLTIKLINFVESKLNFNSSELSFNLIENCFFLFPLFSQYISKNNSDVLIIYKASNLSRCLFTHRMIDHKHSNLCFFIHPLSIALENKAPTEIIYFYFMLLFANWLYSSSPSEDGVLISNSQSEEPKEEILNSLKREKNHPEGIINIAMKEFMDGNITEFYLQKNLFRAIKMIKFSLRHDLKNIDEVGNYISEFWKTNIKMENGKYSDKINNESKNLPMEMYSSMEKVLNNELFYTVYKNGETPLKGQRGDDIEKLVLKKNTFNIWIKEPIEYCCLGKDVSKYLNATRRRLLKVILKYYHYGYVPLNLLYQAINKFPKDVDEMKDATSYLKLLRNELTASQKPFGPTFNPKEKQKQGFWDFDNIVPNFEFRNRFNYCFIEINDGFKEKFLSQENSH